MGALDDLIASDKKSQLDALLAEDEAEQVPQGEMTVGEPEVIKTAKPENGRPWYDSGIFAGARRGMYGNIGNKLAGALLPQNDPNNTYAGQTPGESLEQNFQQEREAHPWQVGIGQVASSIAPAVVSGAAGGALGAAAGRAVGSAIPAGAGLLGALGPAFGGAVGGSLGAGVGGGIVPYAAQTFADQEGGVGERIQGTQQHMKDHPIATAVAGTLPFVAEAAAPITSALGSKLVAAGNKGLARLGLGPAELARLRAIGGEAKLAETGQKMRNAGLDKGGLLPVTAKKLADNAEAVTATHGEKISDLENELLNSARGTTYPGTDELMPFGQTEIDTKPLVQQLRGATRPNSAETSTDATSAAMEAQARRFESPIEEAPVSGEFRAPPPLPNFSQPALPPGYAPPLPVQGEFGFPAPAPKPLPPPQNLTQGRLDLAQQQSLPLPVPEAPLPPPIGAQGELSLETQMPLPGLPKNESPQLPPAPPPAAPPSQGALPIDTQLPLPLAGSPAPQMSRVPNAPVPPPAPGTQLGLDFPPNDIPVGGPLPQNQGQLPLETQMPLPAPAPDPYTPGPLPTQQMDLPGLGGSQRSLPLPAPEPPPAWTPPTPPAAEQTALDIAQQQPLNLPPGGRVQRGEFPAGGTTKPLEATAELSNPYTVERAVLDKRDIGKRLFNKKQRALDENVGADEARKISWRYLRDQFQKEVDKAAGRGALDAKRVGDYRKASADFNIAADVQIDTARKAEQELRQAANKGLVERSFGGAKNALPGTQYNLGRLLQGAGGENAKKLGVGTAEAMSPEQRSKAEQEANSSMKSNMFKSWYNKLAGNQ